MICLRCGRCCFYNVIIINPLSIKEDLDLELLEESDLIILDGTSKCPHLEWEKDQAVCKIHHYKWFKDTPCGRHTQVETSTSTVCRTGKYMRENPDVWEKTIRRINNGRKITT